MKATWKRILTAILCAAILITGLATMTGIDTAYAAKKHPLKVTFNGKSVTLAKDIGEEAHATSLDTLEEKWGKPKAKINKMEGTAAYTWKKGKTSIMLTVYNDGGTCISVNIPDKNGSILGIKTGMAKATALKNLKKATGLQEGEEGIYVYEEYGNPKIDEIINIPISIACKVYLKDGKVTNIYYKKYL